MYGELHVEQKVEQEHLILQPISALRSFILIPIITRAIASQLESLRQRNPIDRFQFQDRQFHDM